ncbi:hypothetical protein VD0004_g9051 [Verticillium dahliae]|nr:hypothetical protein VD0004_g9051 [Verticillium dahliae]PNH63650.1 hypothetical protein VD0001_g9082 [Verticillium dahliae]
MHRRAPLAGRPAIAIIIIIIIIIIITLQRFVVCLPSDSTTSSLPKQINSDHRHQDQDWYTSQPALSIS